MSRRAAALLSPILIPQAAWVIARAQRLPEASGPRMGREGSGPPLRLLIVGDSSAAGVGTDTQDTALAGQLAKTLGQKRTVDWSLIAKTGATTGSTLRDLREHTPIPADVAVLVHGVNDTTRLVPPKRFLENQKALMSLMQTQWGVRRTLVCAVPPVGDFPLLPRPLRGLLGRHAERLDAALLDLVEEAHVPFDIPMDTKMMASDGFHPGPEIYRLWAALLAARIENG